MSAPQTQREIKRRRPLPARGRGRPGAVDEPAGARAGADRGLLVSRGEREEADIERLIRSQPGVTRANTVAMISPKGGVGKTTSTFLVGNLLATHLKLRTIAVDANPDFGTLAAIAPDRLRPGRSLADLIAGIDGAHTAADLSPFVSRLPSGLHVLGAPTDAELMSKPRPRALRRAAGVPVDLLRGDPARPRHRVTDPLARFAIERADQVVLVTTPEFITSQSVAGALRYLAHDRATLVLNQSARRDSADIRRIEAHFREQRLRRSVTIPRDDRLARCSTPVPTRSGPWTAIPGGP